MASTTFVDNSSIIYASWLNDVNSAVYNGTFISSTITPTNIVCNGSVSGTGFSGLVNNTLSAPGQIGNGTPNTGAFTTLSTSGLASLNSLSLTTALSIANGGTGLTAAGSAGSVLTSNGTSWSIAPKITSMTVQASTSGTSITFSSIPSWAKRITVMFSGVTISSGNLLVQIGSGSTQTTGYVSGGTYVGTNTSTGSTSTSGFYIAQGTMNGIMTIANITGNQWQSSHSAHASSATSILGGGYVTLSGVLDRVVISGGTFTAGSINILYE